MRLGLVTDVHSHAGELERAIDRLQQEGVDQIITLGDTCDAFAPSEGSADVTRILSECGAIGVWGNHDFGLCRDVSDSARARFAEEVLQWMSGMRPFLEIDDCFFSHRAADIDPNDLYALWSCEEEKLDLYQRALAGFRAVHHNRQFIGHYHRWAWFTPAGPVAWEGDGSIRLVPEERHFVVIDAVFNGSCAIFDTQSGLLEPLRFEACKTEM